MFKYERMLTRSHVISLGMLQGYSWSRRTIRRQVRYIKSRARDQPELRGKVHLLSENRERLPEQLSLTTPSLLSSSLPSDE